MSTNILYKGEDNTMVFLGGEKFMVKTYVEAQNSFGVPLRTRFTCQVHYTGNNQWQMETLDIKEVN